MEFGAMFGPLLPFLNYLRPTKSPFLLVVMVSIIAIVSTNLNNPTGYRGFLFHIPIYIILFITAIMSFFYKPPESLVEYDEKSDEHAEKLSEIDNQFKFSRTFGLTVSVISLYLLVGRNGTIGGIFLFFSYIFVIFHMLIFSIYMLFRTLKEESYSKLAIFQIAFLTSGFLLGGCWIVNDIQIADKSVLNNCNVTYRLNLQKAEPIFQMRRGAGEVFFRDHESLIELIESDTDAFGKEKEVADCSPANPLIQSGFEYEMDTATFSVNLDWKLFSFLVLMACWLLLISFWVARLKNILRFSVSILE